MQKTILSLLMMSSLSFAQPSAPLPIPTPNEPKEPTIPRPPDPMPGHTTTLTIYPNFKCLESLPSGDAQTITAGANNCDSSNPQRAELTLAYCIETGLEPNTAEQEKLLAKLTSPIDAHQRTVINAATSNLIYTCHN